MRRYLILTLTVAGLAWPASAPAQLPVNLAPTARGIARPDNVLAGQTVTLDGSASSDPDGLIARYDWDLDLNGTYEASTGTTPQLTMAFFTTGVQSVRLKVTDALGASDDVLIWVNVHAPPPPDRLAPILDFVSFDQALGPVLRRGFRARVGCSEACAIGGTLKVGTRAARALRLGRTTTVLGKTYVRLPRAGSRRLTFPLSRRVRRLLRNARRVPVTLEVATHDAAFNIGRSSLRLTLRR